jgi:hypothetical protein
MKHVQSVPKQRRPRGEVTVQAKGVLVIAIASHVRLNRKEKKRKKEKWNTNPIRSEIRQNTQSKNEWSTSTH